MPQYLNGFRQYKCCIEDKTAHSSVIFGCTGKGLLVKKWRWLKKQEKIPRKKYHRRRMEGIMKFLECSRLELVLVKFHGNITGVISDRFNVKC